MYPSLHEYDVFLMLSTNHRHYPRKISLGSKLVCTFLRNKFVSSLSVILFRSNVRNGAIVNGIDLPIEQ